MEEERKVGLFSALSLFFPLIEVCLRLNSGTWLEILTSAVAPKRMKGVDFPGIFFTIVSYSYSPMESKVLFWSIT